MKEMVLSMVTAWLLLHHGQSRGTNCLKIHLQPPYHPLYRGRKTGDPGKNPSKHGLNSTLPYPTLLLYCTVLYCTVLTLESTRGYSQVVTHPSSNPVINFGAQRWEATPQQYTPASVLLNPLFLINFTEQNEVCRLSGFAQLKTNSNKNKIQHATSPFLWRKSYQNRV